MRVEFDSGGWVDIRPIQSLKARDRDVVTLATRLQLPINPSTGELDTDKLIMTGGIQVIQRDALIARLISAWSFTYDDDPDQGRNGQPIPVPTWDGDLQEITSPDSIPELPIDAIVEIEALIKPYQDKMGRKPTPKETTTGSSNGSSKGRVRTLQKD